ncbi:hypothetical protein [Roseateles oligotrophus]|uniref:hypothetical protein n=1 Tax=Roseateles oligotrophus TaxID=1769250 RepID=UPI0021E38B3C|nr:hypothetical protein [Roseateles oligotrophus]
MNKFYASGATGKHPRILLITHSYNPDQPAGIDGRSRPADFAAGFFICSFFSPMK